MDDEVDTEMGGASISPNPRLPSSQKYWAPISPNDFLQRERSYFSDRGSNPSEFVCWSAPISPN